MKKFFSWLTGLKNDYVFRESLKHWAAFTFAVFAFWQLTVFNVITRSPQYVLPPTYASLEYRAGTRMAAVDLETMLRNRSPEIEELVFFDKINQVVVLGSGFESDKLVSNVDLSEIRKLADEIKLPMTTQKAVLENSLWLLLGPLWWFGLAGLVIWASFILFASRSGGDIPSRFSVLIAGISETYNSLSERLGWSHFKLATVAFMAFSAVNIPLLFSGYLVDANKTRLLPVSILQAPPSEDWQILRHLKKYPDELVRATFVTEMNTAFVMLNTKCRVVSADIIGEQLKDCSVARKIVFASGAAGKDSIAEFMKLLDANKKPYKLASAEAPSSTFQTLSGWGTMLFMLQIVLSAGIGVWLAVKLLSRPEEQQNSPPLGKNTAGAGSGGAGGPSPSQQKVDDDTKTFADVAGCQEAIDELQVVKKKILRPRLYKLFGAPLPGGVIFFGPPGTGKTLLARALAGEVGGYFKAMSGSEFVEMYVGVGAQRVREAYAKARAEARRRKRVSIVFIDEIDAIGKKRGTNTEGGSREYEQTLNQLLVEMNGFANHGLVLTMAATNRLDILDDALLRPGRFDIKVMVPKPDRKGRAQIFNVYLRKLKLVLEGATEEERKASYDRLLMELSRRSHDFSGADIESAVKTGATIAVERQFGDASDDLSAEQEAEYREKAIITAADLNLGVDKLAYGTQIKSRVRTDSERWATSVHEIGHALIPTLDPKGDKVNRITIVMTEKSLGLMDSSPEEGERYDWTDEQFAIRLKTMLAGRAAEKALLGKISTGASNDFERASALARQMVGVFGMTKEFGVKSIPLDQHGFPVSNIGQALMNRFNDTWGKIIDDCEKTTAEIIEAHRDVIEYCAKALYKEEVLTGDEFRRLLKEALALRASNAAQTSDEPRQIELGSSAPVEPKAKN